MDQTPTQADPSVATLEEGTMPASKPPAPGAQQSAEPITAFHRRTGRRIGVALVLLAIALGATVALRWPRGHAGASQASAPHADLAPTVEVEPVVLADPETSLVLPGEARAFCETTLYARTSGYLKEWLVDIGDHVTEGQLLATIDTPELDDKIKECQAQLEERRSEVTLAQASADFANTSFNRWNAPDGVVSQQERDQKKSELDTSAARLVAAKAKVRLGEAELDTLRTLEAFKRVTAPFSGIVTERYVDIGHLVTAGSGSSTTPMFKVVQYDQARVFVDVPQAVSDQVTVGMPVVAFEPGRPDRKYEGKVSRTSGAIDPRARTLSVEVLVPNSDHALLPGAYLQVALKTRRSPAPFKIPAAAVTMRSSGPQAAVVHPDGTVEFRKLSIVQDLGDTIEVRSGLSEHELVALNIGQDIADGDRVVPQQLANQGHADQPAVRTTALPR
jgi:RND family efflux transporter MFP subunit